MKKTPPSTAIWSDERYFVRPAAKKDPHKMRFVLAPYSEDATLKQRHIPTLEDGIKLARRAAHLVGQKSRTTKQDEPVPVLAPVVPQPFRMTRFNCYKANAVSQVWVCVKHEGEVFVGRKREGGRPGHQVQLDHKLGEMVVMVSGEPIREPDGRVKVFKTIGAADLAAMEAYYAAPEDDRYNINNTLEVDITTNLVICFDPATNGAHSPFHLYFPAKDAVIFANHMSAGNDGGVSIAQLRNQKGKSEQALMELVELKKRNRQLARRPSLTTTPATFRSIEGARERAWKIEESLGGRYLGPPGSLLNDDPNDHA